MEVRKKQFAVYSRKSKFTGKGESIGNQIELCRQYISSHYGDDFAGSAYIYEDEGFSGKNLVRPQFQKMMADDNFSVEELAAIALGYTKLLEQSSAVLTELKTVNPARSPI